MICINCNAHPDDIIDITEDDEPIHRWCCDVCNALWAQEPGSDMVQVFSEGNLEQK